MSSFGCPDRRASTQWPRHRILPFDSSKLLLTQGLEARFRPLQPAFGSSPYALTVCRQLNRIHCMMLYVRHAHINSLPAFTTPRTRNLRTPSFSLIHALG